MSFHVGVKKRTPNVTGMIALSQRKAGTGCRPAPINQNPEKTIEWRMSSWEGGTQPTWSHGALYTSRHPPLGSATPTTVPIIAPSGVTTALPKYGNQSAWPLWESTPAPAEIGRAHV